MSSPNLYGQTLHHIDLTRRTSCSWTLLLTVQDWMHANFEKLEIEKLQPMNIIEPAQSEWASSIVFDSKKYGSLRSYRDYRKVNAVTVKDAYRIPRMDKCLYLLGEEHIISMLDANSRYCQVEIDHCNRDKMTLTSQRGLYRILQMLFALKNAPVMLQ